MTTKRQKLIQAGLCVNYFRCLNERGEDGTATECRPCAGARNRMQAESNRAARTARRRQDKLCAEPNCNSRRGKGKNGKLLRLCTEHAVQQQETMKAYRKRLRLRSG
jgi:hypothetical protein